MTLFIAFEGHPRISGRAFFEWGSSVRLLCWNHSQLQSTRGSIGLDDPHR